MLCCHQHKPVIIDAGASVGQGNRIIDNWYIPKQELMQNVVPNIGANSVPIQFSTDITEHAHIMEIKCPAQAGNNYCYEAQICWDFDCTDKLCCFQLATSICDLLLEPSDYCDSNTTNQSNLDISQEDVNDAPATILLAQLMTGFLQSPSNYFDEATVLKDDPKALFFTFTDAHTTFHLICNPTFKQMTINEATKKFGLLDLCAALMDFMHHYMMANFAIYGISDQQSTVALTNFISPKVQVWSGVHIQLKSFHDVDEATPLQLVNACSPCADWLLGLYDSVIINTNKPKSRPQCRLDGTLIFISFAYIM